MKSCPICGSLAFDDAGKCFGCLHPFDGDIAASSTGRTASFSAGDVPSFVISLTPVACDANGISWSCSVRTEDQPAI